MILYERVMLWLRHWNVLMVDNEITVLNRMTNKKMMLPKKMSVPKHKNLEISFLIRWSDVTHPGRCTHIIERWLFLISQERLLWLNGFTPRAQEFTFNQPWIETFNQKFYFVLNLFFLCCKSHYDIKKTRENYKKKKW